MRIGSLEIGNGWPMRIIAEIGTLHIHQGLKGMLKITEEAFKHGADLVKTQLINSETTWWATREQRERYRSFYDYMFLDKWTEYLKICNRDFGPTFSSVFDESYVRLFDALVPAWKIGYKATFMPSLVQTVLETRKPVILSITNLEQRAKLVPPKFRESSLFLYVQPHYPTNSEQFLLPDLRLYDGISLHSNDPKFAEAAFVFNPKLIEIHIQGEGANGPDTSFALTLPQLSELKSMVT